MKNQNEFRILSPTAILGYGFPESSFMRGIRRKPHLIAVDAGSTDPGPYYLGAGKSFTNRAGVKRDLRYMLTEGVHRNIPVVVGSAGGCGAKPHVEWCKEIILEIAKEEKLHFKMAVVYADVDKALVRKHLSNNNITPLACVPPLKREAVDASVNIVAQMGMEPIQRAIKKGCQVILCGRCYDPAVFAALPVSLGYDKALCLHLGKILECAAIAATPGSGADCVLGILNKDSFMLESLNPKRIFTAASTAAHTLYEKSDPYHLPGPGGAIDLKACTFTELPGGRVEVKGSRYKATKTYFVKLEGARRTGFRTISIAGTRDPVMIKGIDSILSAVNTQVESMLKRDRIQGKVYFHVYGKNAIMGSREPVKETKSHEIGIIIDALAATQEAADTLCSLTRSTLLHYGYPGRIATAGNLAFPFSPSDIKSGEVFEFSLYHLMPVEKQSIFKSRILHV